MKVQVQCREFRFHFCMFNNSLMPQEIIRHISSELFHPSQLYSWRIGSVRLFFWRRKRWWERAHKTTIFPPPVCMRMPRRRENFLLLNSVRMMRNFLFSTFPLLQEKKNWFDEHKKTSCIFHLCFHHWNVTKRLSYSILMSLSHSSEPIFIVDTNILFDPTKQKIQAPTKRTTFVRVTSNKFHFSFQSHNITWVKFTVRKSSNENLCEFFMLTIFYLRNIVNIPTLLNSELERKWHQEKKNEKTEFAVGIWNDSNSIKCKILRNFLDFSHLHKWASRLVLWKSNKVNILMEKYHQHRNVIVNNEIETLGGFL